MLTVTLVASVVGAITALATLYAARVLPKAIPRLGFLGRATTLEWIFALGPSLVIVIGVWIAYVTDTRFVFPAPDFYRTAAEVIPIVLVALIIEGEVISHVRRPILVVYGLLFVVGEVAAFVAVSESLPGAPGYGRRVGGEYGWTVVLAMATSMALIASAVLAAAAVISRGSSPSREP